MGLRLALVHDVEGIVWFAAVIAGAQALRGRLRRRWMDGATGAVLIGFGVKLGLGDR